MGDNRRSWRRRGRVLGWAAIGLFFAVMLGVVAALAFSVRVYGDSMQPTLRTGDRLIANAFARDDVRRFDLVETTAGSGGIPVVKRVVGLPGDRIEIRGGSMPQVLVRPADATTTYRVDNPAWASRIGGASAPCCRGDGTSGGAAEPAQEVVGPPDSYWVLGDNWGASDDSRVFGFVTAEDIRATVNVRILPLGDLGVVDSDVRLVPTDH